MADVTLEELCRQLAIQAKEIKQMKQAAKLKSTEINLLTKANNSLKQKASQAHRPLAMWLNSGKDGKPDYYRIVMTDIDGQILLNLLKQGGIDDTWYIEQSAQAENKPPAKLSFTVFKNDFKREGVDSDPDFHGRMFTPEKQS